MVEPDLKRGPTLGAVGCLSAATVQLHQRFDDSQTQAGRLFGVLALDKALEDIRQLTFGDAGAAVGDLQTDLGFSFPDAQTHHAARRRGPQRVVEQVAQDLHQPGLVDLGYLGLERLHAQTFLPIKATKHHPLTYEEKQANRVLARLRLHIERVIGRLKVFRILTERYRGCRKRFSLRFNLIAGIHNVELGLSS